MSCLKQAQVTRHWLRNFLMHGFHVLVMLVVGGAIRDTQCGFKVGATFLNTRIDGFSCSPA